MPKETKKDLVDRYEARLEVLEQTIEDLEEEVRDEKITSKAISETAQESYQTITKLRQENKKLKFKLANSEDMQTALEIATETLGATEVYKRVLCTALGIDFYKSSWARVLTMTQEVIFQFEDLQAVNKKLKEEPNDCRQERELDRSCEGHGCSEPTT